ncbi:hypothetical protein [Brevundimonas sp. A19_0]|uniref:hypothetical protein n=1 Tax=Brevundimonas sp. A19_0 TaxID=2821087 RepID=UPI001ADBADAF|nr:hypothetical protein [Brevundimonas sp. A19_0]MBO9502679.1 hypothetical protein [Brevundimonas sp. A19_0]
MLRDKTLFIVGAGASSEFKLPVGWELAEQISRKLDLRFSGSRIVDSTGDLGILDAIQTISNGDVNSFLHACWLIRDGIQFSYSIDNFIDTHRHNKRVDICGKLAIAKCIMDAERKSTLYTKTHDGPNPALNAMGTWISGLIRVMQNGVTKDHVDQFFDDSAFIVFNYDRCLEHFFYHALKGLYGMSDAESASIMEKMRVYHPYGKVGALPWQVNSLEKSVSFGSEDRARFLVPLLNGIKTYTEQTDSKDNTDKIADIVDQSDTIVFLGFSFLPQNLDLLGRGIKTIRRRRVIGTGKGLSRADREIVSRSLAGLTRPDSNDVIIEEATCAELIAQYGRFLGR